MKTSLLYGCVMTLATSIFTLIMFLMGAHSNAEKMNSTGMIALIVYVLIGIVVLVMGIRARRSEIPEDRGFSYGQALGTGILIAVTAAFTGMLFQLVYENFINTNFVEVQTQAQALKMAARGMSDDKIEQSQAMMKKWSSPLVRAIVTFLFIFVCETIYSLIVAAFCTRKDPNEATSL